METIEKYKETLRTKHWFKKTSDEIRKELMNLPQDFEGLIKDLVERPEEIGTATVLRLVKFAAGHYLAILVFEVRSILTNEIYTYEYVSWKYGRETGSRGIILLTENNNPKFFIVRKSERFALGKEIYDAIGSFYPKFGDENYIDLPTKVEKQIRSILKIDELKFDRVIDLGVISPDSGQSNQIPALFAINIDITGKDDEIKQMIKDRKHGSSKYSYDLEVFSIKDIMSVVQQTPDGYFMSIVARCMSMGLIPKHDL